MTKIYVDIGQNVSVANPFDYNSFNAEVESVGTAKADLQDDTGALTGVSLEVDTAFPIAQVSAGNASTSVGEFTEAVLDGYGFTANGGTSVLRLTGLPNGASYTLDLIGHIATATRDTQFTVEGVSKDYITSGDAAAPTAATQFTGTVDPDGEIIISVTKAATGTFYGYLNGFVLDYTSAALTIDSSPSSISSTESFSFTVSGPATAPTTGNTTGNFTGLTGIAPDSVTGSDPYTITWTLPRTTAKLFDATGYVFDITIDAESVSSSAIPYEPPTGSDYITVGTIDTGAQVYTDYTGGTFVSTDQLVWDNSPSLSFTDDLNYVVTGTLSATVYRIAAAGTVDVENTITFSLSDDGTVSAVIKPIISNVISSVVN